MLLSAPIRVRLLAKDVDGMSINFTRAEIHLAFGGWSVPMSWVNRGSNEYTADVPTELTAQPGLYALVVTASEAWSETAGQMTHCELLRRNVRIDSVATTVNVQTIIYSAVAGALLLIVGVVAIYMACKHRRRAAQLFVSFLRGETLLALKILMELLDISSDSTPLSI
jgi:hypothetical protein